MVSHLVGDDVSISEVAVSTKLALHRCEEREVNVQGLVSRAVEWSYGSIAGTTTRLHTTSVEHHARGDIRLAQLLLEHVAPYILGTGEHLRGEECQLLLFLGELTFLLIAGRDVLVRDSFQTTSLLESLKDVAACEPSHQARNDDSTDAAYSGLRCSTHTPTIVDIRAFSSSCYKIYRNC